MVIKHCKQLDVVFCTILRRSSGHNTNWRVFFSEREKIKTSLFSCLNKHTENHLLLWRWLFHQVCVHSQQESEEGISGEHANFAFRQGISRGQKTNGRGCCLHSFSREPRGEKYFRYFSICVIGGNYVRERGCAVPRECARCFLFSLHSESAGVREALALW
jgi:hypothetical protein